jgi:hypothetical protein
MVLAVLVKQVRTLNIAHYFEHVRTQPALNS